GREDDLGPFHGYQLLVGWSRVERPEARQRNSRVRPSRATRRRGTLRIVRRGPGPPTAMAMLRFLFRRLMAQRLLALGVVLTLAFSVGVMASGPIYTDAARESILTSTIVTATVPTKNVRVDVYGGASCDQRQAEATVEDAASVLPVDQIVAQGESTVRVGPDATRATSVPMLFRDGSEEHLTFRSGRAPHHGEIALPSGLA